MPSATKVWYLRRAAATLSAKLGQQPVHGQKEWRGDESRRGLVARPRIGIGCAGGPGAHRSEHDVSAELDQITVPVNYDRLEPALQDVADPAMTAVKGSRIDAVELAHGVREISLRRFHNEMEVIVHQAVGVQQQVNPGNDMPEQPKKPLPVFVIQKDVPSGVAPGGDVVEGPGIFDPQWSRHETYPSSSRMHKTRPIFSE